MFDSLTYALDVTLPISLIIGLGILLKRIGWITDEFAKAGSDLVFNLTLPCLLFVNIATTNLTDHFPILLIVFAGSVMTAAFLIFHLLAYGIANKLARGAFVQGACRGKTMSSGEGWLRRASRMEKLRTTGRSQKEYPPKVVDRRAFAGA